MAWVSIDSMTRTMADSGEAKGAPSIDALTRASGDLQAGRLDAAIGTVRELLAVRPDDPQALHLLALALWDKTAEPDEPLSLLHRALALTPNNASVHHNLASVIASIGDFTDAERHFRRAIELNPRYVTAMRNISGAIRFTADDPLIPHMLSLYARGDLSDAEREELCFALCSAMSDIGRHEEACHFALEGGRLKQAVYNAEAMQEAVASQQAVDWQGLFDSVREDRDVGFRPIFIVGMPRAGTTLVEQILAAHSRVFAAGELTMMGSIDHQMKAWARTHRGWKGTEYGHLPLMPPDHFTRAATACATHLTDRAGAPFLAYTDKMPSNAFLIGLIALMFPTARVIHVRRHPLDTCISCLFQRFRFKHDFSYALESLGDYYRAYDAIMSVWCDAVPLPIREIWYEHVVADVEGAARDLIAFAELDWEPACASPEAVSSSIVTASRRQARQPVNTASVARWRRHERFLEPLIEALGGEDWIATRTPPERPHWDIQ